MNLEAVDGSLAIVDGWIAGRAEAGGALSSALEALTARVLENWTKGATEDQRARARETLTANGLDAIASRLLPPESAIAQTSMADCTGTPSAVDALHERTRARGAEAYEVVEQAFRRSIARMGSRFVATRARAAIDETMGPMHSTVVVAELLSMLELIDAPYLEALTYALETMHDWRAVAERAHPTKEKAGAPRKRNASPLSTKKRRT